MAISPRLRGEDPYQYMVGELAKEMSWNTLLISDDIANLEWNVTKELQALSGTVQRGLSDISWRLEQHQQIFQEMNAKLATPMGTAARELRARGLDYYQKEWYDNALDAFRDSLKLNPADFVVHHTIGDIHLFHIKDLPEALKHFELAAKFARPESLHYSAYSLLYKALTQFEMGDVEGARASATEAVRRDKGLSEAHYSLAKYAAQLGQRSEASGHLAVSILLDPKNYDRVSNDALFHIISSEIQSVQKTMYRSAQDTVQTTIEQAKVARQEAIVALAPSYATRTWEEAERSLNEANSDRARARYVDIRKAIITAYQSISAFREVTKAALYARRVELERALDDRKLAIENERSSASSRSRRSPLLAVFCAASFVLGYVLGMSIIMFSEETQDGNLLLSLCGLLATPLASVLIGAFLANAVYRLRGQPRHEGVGMWYVAAITIAVTIAVFVGVITQEDILDNESAVRSSLAVLALIGSTPIALTAYLLKRQGISRSEDKHYESLLNELEQARVSVSQGQIVDPKQIPARLKLRLPS